MRPLLALLLLALLAHPATAQLAPPPTSTTSSSTPAANPTPAPTDTPSSSSAADRLTQSNRDLLDLLKKQQSVLADIQYDRRLQSRQIQSLEERLEEQLQQNAQLQAKIAKLETTLAAVQANPPVTIAPNGTNTAASPTPPVKETPTPPPHIGSYLPAPETEGAPGTKSWHRLFTLSGDDTRKTELFHVQGRQWRVLWHNLDKPGAAYVNTSALFINAFPKDDTIPQKVCSKLGSGGDSTELEGPGNYYLKIEASGGSWELAVEDFR